MLKAYLIQCHKDPLQVNRLIDTLSHKDVHIYIHVDLKADISPQIKTGPSVFLIRERIDVQWGTISQVHATLALLNAAMNSGVAYDYLSLISGQDYPVKSSSYILDFLEQNAGREFLETFELPVAKWRYNGGIGRVSYYWPDRLTPKRSLVSKVFRNIYLYTLARLFKRSLNNLPNLYGGSQWFTISGELAAYILKYLSSNPGYLKRFENTGCADEIFFQTIIMNSSFAKNVVNDNLRYICWKGSSNPEVLDESYYPEIAQSTALFARKFDNELSNELLNKIDSGLRA